MVGESLLSVRVIAPGVGADFLSTGICSASLGPVAPLCLTLAIASDRKRKKEKKRDERKTEIIYEMRATFVRVHTRDRFDELGIGLIEKFVARIRNFAPRIYMCDIPKPCFASLFTTQFLRSHRDLIRYTYFVSLVIIYNRIA